MPSPTDAKPAQKLDYAAIKDRIDIVDYIGRYTTVIRSGARYKAKCPLPGHNDKTASLTIYPESKSWWCFGCHQGRDIFDFAAKMEGLKPQEIDT